jgi:hypothetical protein
MLPNGASFSTDCHSAESHLNDCHSAESHSNDCHSAAAESHSNDCHSAKGYCAITLQRVILLNVILAKCHFEECHPVVSFNSVILQSLFGPIQFRQLSFVQMS